jgi:hypothetical protein
MRSLCLLAIVAACVDDPIEEEEVIDTSLAVATFPGVNGDWCVASPFDCRFRAPGVSQRVVTASGLESWGIEPGASLRDGHGNVLATVTNARLTFNYGQTRALAGKAHALALATSNGSAGWYPIDHILGEQSFRARMGEVNAHDPHDGRLGCYRIRNSHDPDIELRKVVYDSHATHERAGDYLPLERENGKRSANLIFMVPGFGLGGASTDHFPAGTMFHRVNVPTTTGRPSITIPLWVEDGAGRYRKQKGSMTFMYGFIVGDGVKRFGWMAREALVAAPGC